MANMQIKRNWLAVTGIGTAIVFLSLWLPWMFVPAEVALKRAGYQDLISPGTKALYQDLISPGTTAFISGLATMETGLRGAISIGILIPSWIFIALLVVAGIISCLTISKIFEVSFWIFALPLILSITFLTYWATTSLALGCSLGAGFPIAAIGSAMILFVAIKNNQMENKASLLTGMNSTTSTPTSLP